MSGRGTVGGKDVNRIGSGFAVDDTDKPRSTSRSVACALTRSTYYLLSTDKQGAGTWFVYVVDVGMSWLHGEKREQAYIAGERYLTGSFSQLHSQWWR